MTNVRKNRLAQLKRIATRIGGPQEPWQGSKTLLMSHLFGAFVRHAEKKWGLSRSFSYQPRVDTIANFLIQTL